MPRKKKRKKNTRTKKQKYESCVLQLKERGGVRSPYAVCRKAIYGSKKRKRKKYH